MTPQNDLARFTRQALIVIGLVTVLILVWTLLPVLMLVFGAIVFAAMLLSLAHLLQRLVPVSDGIALAVVLVLLSTSLGLMLWLFGSQVSSELATLVETLPPAYEQFNDWVEDTTIGRLLAEQTGILRNNVGRIATSAGAIAMTLSGGVMNLLLVFIGAIYIAAQPGLYRAGMLQLVPRSVRTVFADALDASARALRLWLGGQLIAMAAVAVLTGLGLWLLGVPAAFALALIAFLFDFVPIIGPIAAAIPGILLGFTVSPRIGVATAVLYLVIQQLESNLLQPLIQQRAVELPPALLLFSLLVFGGLQGFTGLLLAAPLTVVLYVLVKRLYVREMLDTPTVIPGESSPQSTDAAPR